MSHPLTDGFTDEAKEYLSRLDALLSRAEAPDPEELLRLARGVRDSAASAGAHTTARVAQRLEDAAGSFASRGIVWSAEFRDLARQTVSDLQILIRALDRWGPEEEDRVRTAIARWTGLAGEGSDEAAPVPPGFHEAGPDGLAGPHRQERVGVAPAEPPLPRGEAALQAAIALRPRIDALLRGGAADPALREALDELFALLRLAGTRGGPRG